MAAPKNPFKFFSNETNKGAALNGLGQGLFAGQYDQSVFTWTGVIVDREVFTVDPGGQTENVYEAVLLATDSTFDALTDFNNTDPQDITFTRTNASSTFSVGQYFAIDSEIFRVKAVAETDEVKCARAQAGTAIAAHSTTTSPLNIQEATALTAGAITVPTLALTSTAYQDRLVGIVGNESNEGWIFIKRSTTVGVLRAKTYGARGKDVTETFTNASVITPTEGGADHAAAPVYVEARVPTAAEVTAGEVFIHVPFAPAHVVVQVRTTATDAIVAWDGAVLYTLKGDNILIVDNTGAVDWSVAETIHITVFGEKVPVRQSAVNE